MHVPNKNLLNLLSSLLLLLLLREKKTNKNEIYVDAEDELT